MAMLGAELVVTLGVGRIEGSRVYQATSAAKTRSAVGLSKPVVSSAFGTAIDAKSESPKTAALPTTTLRNRPATVSRVVRSTTVTPRIASGL